MVETGPYNIMYTSNQLEEWEISLGYRLNDYHRANPLPSTAVCILDGGFQFFTRTIRYAAFDLNIDFCKVSSYLGTEKTGTFQIQRFKDHDGYEINLEPNQRIYIFDDILDSGETAKKVAEYYQENFNPAELILCTAFVRKNCPIAELEKYYSKIHNGFKIDDEWLVGYGMDNPQGFMRQAPSVLKMKKV